MPVAYRYALCIITPSRRTRAGEHDMHDLTESRAFMAGWALGCASSLLLVLAYTLIAWSI